MKEDMDSVMKKYFGNGVKSSEGANTSGDAPAVEAAATESSEQG